jgi:hypothetical protein
MGNAESAEPRRVRPAGIPRWLVLALSPVVWLVALPAVHVGIPWALSHLGPRYGWADGGPSGWNLLGYAPLRVPSSPFAPRKNVSVSSRLSRAAPHSPL